jgi:hypothetical protein
MKRVVDVHFDAETVTVTYDHDALLRAIGHGAATALPANSLATEVDASVDVLAEALVSWNLSRGDQPLATDRETLNHMPIGVLFKIGRAITDDAFDAG